MINFPAEWNKDIDNKLEAQYLYAIVSSINGDGTLGVKRTPTSAEETYHKLRSYNDPAVGDKVRLMRDGIGWLIYGAIG